MSEPAQKPGKSRQDYCTPPEFLRAVADRFGGIDVDLAATPDNAVVSSFINGNDENALLRDWPSDCLCWLNPPFGLCAEFAAKCAQQSARGCRILMLTPASVGSNWFAEHVMGKASVLFLSPRLTFGGAKDPYPRDLMLTVWDRRYPAGFECWRWK